MRFASISTPRRDGDRIGHSMPGKECCGHGTSSQALRDSNKADLEKRLLEEQVNDSKA